MRECATALRDPELTAQNTAVLNGMRRVAAIDLGSNSTHLVIAEVDPLLCSFSVLVAEKSTTRLGERDVDNGELTVAAMERTRLALRHCRELARSHGVEEIIGVATSAMREAPNGLAFLAELRESLGLNLEVISGTEEARLIYLGVLSGKDFSESPHLILDIGGGSTELVLADAKEARALTSARVGAVRLQRDFVKREPLDRERVDFLRAFIQGSLEPSVDKVLRRLNPGETPVMVATSGTAMAVAALLEAESARNSARLHGKVVSKIELDGLVERILPLTPLQRKELTGINERRAEILVPGLLVLQTAMALLGAKQFEVSDRALREGLIVDWMLRHGLIVDRFAYQSEIRERTVWHQARKFGVDEDRVERVAANAITLFDQTKGSFHDFSEQQRELLWAAAMLHNCGLHINTSGYHKHSWYLINNGELLGYSQSEQLLIASLARYHRRSLPKKRHESWLLLDRDQRRIVETLSLLLRLAAAMNRRPEAVIAAFEARCIGGSFNLKLQPCNATEDLSLELWSLESCAAAFTDSGGYSLSCGLISGAA
ncbi:Ppx/GppA phosphatase family protein [Synechococcus sp.]